MSIQNISFLGAGSIAEAIISGLLDANIVSAKQITVSNRSNEARLQELHTKYGIKGTHDKQALLTNANILFLAMKPKDIVEAIVPLKKVYNKYASRNLITSRCFHSLDC